MTGTLTYLTNVQTIVMVKTVQGTAGSFVSRVDTAVATIPMQNFSGLGSPPMANNTAPMKMSRIPRNTMKTFSGAIFGAVHGKARSACSIC